MFSISALQRLAYGDSMEISSDFKELLYVFNAVAVGFHDAPRATADFDVWVGASPVNAPKVYRALATFGAPLDALSVEELAAPDLVFMFGVPPFRIDVLTTVDGVEFVDAWNRRVSGKLGEVPVWYIGREDLIANKLAAGRGKDILDVERLRKHAQ
jgi:hypothetical protein